jgi:hypothetical protein
VRAEPSPRHAGLLAVAAVAAVAWPLITYTVTLATFGLVHVLAELRYVDRRFSPRVGDRLAAALVAVVAALAGLALLGNLGVVSVVTGRGVELWFGLALVAVIVPTLWRRRPSVVPWAGVAAIGLLVALATSPAHGLLMVAVLHNLTPLAFVADATTGAARRRALGRGFVVFGVVPLAIASGLGWALLSPLGLTAPEATVGFAGPLEQHMRAYLPPSMLGTTAALHAFSACAFLQCAHYLYVIDVLPRTLPTGARGRLPWPDGSRWLVVVAVGTLVGFAMLGFVPARSWYGIAASLHAWIELPLLLLALAVAPRRRIS